MPRDPGVTVSAATPGRDVPRFGLHLHGTPIVFEAGEMLEYLVAPAVHRMPLAPRRMRGLMQLRGHPLAVFDVQDSFETASVPAVLVIGSSPRCAALVVPGPPQPVHLGPQVDGETAARSADAPSVVFADALAQPRLDQNGVRWWPVNATALFTILAGDTGEAGA